MLKVCQPRKHFSCFEYFLGEIPTKLNRDIFTIIIPQRFTFIIFV